MTGKSKLFKGMSAADVSLRLRRYVPLLFSLPDSKLEAFKKFFLDAAKASRSIRALASSSSQVSRLAELLGIPLDEARNFLNASSYLATRLADLNDDPEDVAQDLVALGLAESQQQEGVRAFVKTLAEVSPLVADDRKREETVAGGGYNLHGWKYFQNSACVMLTARKSASRRRGTNRKSSNSCRASHSNCTYSTAKTTSLFQSGSPKMTWIVSRKGFILLAQSWTLQRRL